MVQTTIESIDATGREVPPDPELKRQVERAAAMLESQLASLTQFTIQSGWRIVHQPGSAPRVELELTSNGVGVRDWLFDTRGWNDNDQIRRSLYAPGWAFADVLDNVLRERMEHDRQRFDALMPIAEE